MTIRVLLYGKGMHHKIAAAIPRMCAAMGCSLENTTSLERVKQGDYDLLVSPMSYIPPDIIPPNVRTIIGPQLYVFPEGPTVGPYAPQFEGKYVINVLSNWIIKIWQDHAKSMRFPVVPMPTGVDTVRFAPDGSDRDTVILYTKHRSRADIAHMQSLLAEHSIVFKKFSYGSYKEEDYLHALRAAKFMVVVDAHESQGYALQEAMSCGVPLLVWDVESMYQEYNGGRQVYSWKGNPLRATTVPWWSDVCGLRTTKKEELPALLESIQSTWSSFRPREYVLEHLSDAACMKRWLDCVGLSRS